MWTLFVDVVVMDENFDFFEIGRLRVNAYSRANLETALDAAADA